MCGGANDGTEYDDFKPEIPTMCRVITPLLLSVFSLAQASAADPAVREKATSARPATSAPKCFTMYRAMAPHPDPLSQTRSPRRTPACSAAYESSLAGNIRTHEICAPCAST